MEHEVDFLPVGDGERGGDAICFRYGYFDGNRDQYVVVVIDGGTKASGEALVEHIKKYYETEIVDLVISTHPDADHCSGLTEVIEGLDVRMLWMHKPWEHAEEIRTLFKNGKITDESLRVNLRKSLENARELHDLAARKSIPIYEPFSDSKGEGSQFLILGPSKEFYQSLLPHFRDTPQPKQEIAGLQTLLGRALEAAKDGINWVKENWGVETLTDPENYKTSFENNSSVILYCSIDGKGFLFTGDAGVEALDLAHDKAVSLGIDLTEVKFIQMPHHGSKRNVGPTILDKIIGPKLSAESESKTAFVSAPAKGDPKHPSRKVVNAFKRRGAKVIATQGDSIRHPSPNAPDRNWSKANPLPFYNDVEE